MNLTSAYRAVLTIALLYVVWMLVPQIGAYANLVIHTTQESHKTVAQLRKLSAADLQTELIRAGRIAPNAGLRCTRAARDWDYVCSYMLTPLQSTTRLEFGVMVDDKHSLKMSGPIPEGTTLPPPQ